MEGAATVGAMGSGTVVAAFGGLAAAAVALGCSSGSSQPPSGPRHFNDALGRQCTEVPATPYFTLAGCQTPIALGASTTCQVAPMPEGGCSGAMSCWSLRGIVAFDDAGAAEYVGAPAPPADGGGIEFAALCAGCCTVDDAGPNVGNLSACAAIPCKSASDCPLESCGCGGAWCQ